MEIIADLHLHSKHSRATSKNLDFENLEKYAKIKGVNLLGTGDFCHPIWNKEIKTKLHEKDNGTLVSKTGFPFILTNEISLIYTQNNKGRRVHLVLLAPNLAVVDQITEYLLKHGRIDYDGRPIFKITCEDFTYELKKISKDIEVIPAHIWTPWFSMFGSKSGFDTVKECFGDQTKHIHAIETGLSSDPPMNWRLSQLDKFSILSFSDAHSFWPWRLGREATLFDIDLTYKNLIKSIKTQQGLIGTIEVDPNYGKYHIDGHRNCNISMHPQESIKHKGICPVCKKPLTIGVLYRVEELADRPFGFTPPNPKKFHSLIPLSELISAVKGGAVATKKVQAEFFNLVNGRSEYDVLLRMPEEELLKLTEKKLVETILLNRV
ncbi:MAG: endonuclease Q family protein, partial [Candidatus Woesearchaeota archaeon]|nr:endonuclease Q family protein [Candidatus Woesearchaeota archaeon]